MNPLPDRSNYSPLLPHPLPLNPYPAADQYFNSLLGPDPLPGRSSGRTLLQRFIAESSLGT